jgi:hypothetical protein
MESRNQLTEREKRKRRQRIFAIATMPFTALAGLAGLRSSSNANATRARPTQAAEVYTLEDRPEPNLGDYDMVLPDRDPEPSHPVEEKIFDLAEHGSDVADLVNDFLKKNEKERKRREDARRRR